MIGCQRVARRRGQVNALLRSTHPGRILTRAGCWVWFSRFTGGGLAPRAPDSQMLQFSNIDLSSPYLSIGNTESKGGYPHLTICSYLFCFPSDPLSGRFSASCPRFHPRRAPGFSPGFRRFSCQKSSENRIFSDFFIFGGFRLLMLSVGFRASDPVSTLSGAVFGCFRACPPRVHICPPRRFSASGDLPPAPVPVRCRGLSWAWLRRLQHPPPGAGQLAPDRIGDGLPPCPVRACPAWRGCMRRV